MMDRIKEAAFISLLWGIKTIVVIGIILIFSGWFFNEYLRIRDGAFKGAQVWELIRQEQIKQQGEKK